MKTLFYIEKRDETGWDRGCGSYIQFQGKRRMIQGKLKIDTEKVGDGNFWMIQRGLYIKAEYSMKDRIEQQRYNEAEILEDGETVEIMRILDKGDSMEPVSKKQYKFIAVGDYSDCGKFEAID